MARGAELNRALGKLRSAGFEPADLIPLPRVAGREPPVRLVVEHGDPRKELSHLLQLVAEIRRLGEKGISVTRFKGLGEMDPEELWDTTLDPQHRTLLRVTLNDALKAEEMFRTLMGEEVEGRKKFIMSRTSATWKKSTMVRKRTGHALHHRRRDLRLSDASPS